MALDAPFFKLNVDYAAPKDKKFSLYVDQGWFVVNERFIDETLARIEKCNEFEKQLDKCLTTPPNFTSAEIMKRPEAWLSLVGMFITGGLVGFFATR